MIIENILNWIRDIWRKLMVGKQTIEQAISMEIAISQPMIEAITEWSLVYENKAPWLSDKVQSLNLPATICTEIANLVTVEMEITIEPAESPLAVVMNEQLNPFRKAFPEQLEFAIAKGGMVIKPYLVEMDGNGQSPDPPKDPKDPKESDTAKGPETTPAPSAAKNGKAKPKKKRIAYEYIQADQFYPIEYGNDGEITAAVFVDQRHIGDHYYTRLEYHRLVGNIYEITNKAFKSTTKENLGSEIPLDQVQYWKALEPAATIKNVKRTLFVYFHYPMANNIDTSSPLGVSAYSRALKHIKDADETWSRFMWELESSERALYVDVLAFTRDKDKKPILPDKRLYRTLDTGEEVSNFYQEFSPTVREQNYLASLNSIYKRIEQAVGLATGTISDPNQEALTATEIVTSKQRTYATVTGLQNSIRETIDHLIWIVNFWVTISKMAAGEAYEVTIEFDDSVIVDKATRLQQDLLLVQSGLMSRVEFRMRNLGEDEKTAKKAVADIDKAMMSNPMFDEDEEDSKDE